MIPVDLGSIILLVLGSVLTLSGGLAATYFSQYIAGRAEKKKVVREKLEEIYILINQIKFWSQMQLLEICKLRELEPFQYIIDVEDLKKPRAVLEKMSLEDLCRLIDEHKMLKVALQQTEDTGKVIEYIRKLAGLEAGESMMFWYLYDPADALGCPIDRLVMLVNLYAPELRKFISSYRMLVFSIRGIVLLGAKKEEKDIQECFMMFELSHRSLQSQLETIAFEAH